MAKITVVPGSVLLVAVGERHALSARAVDAAGVPVAAQVTWTSSRPEDVAISPSGEVTAIAQVGSAQLVAQVGDVKSEPALVIVAEVHPGTVLVTDAQIASPAVGVGGGYEQFTITLRDVPPPLPGAVLLSRESTPLAGRVVSSAPSPEGLVVTCATIGLPEAFVDLSIDQKVAMPVPPEQADEGVSRSPLVSEFSKGPFKCKSELGETLTFSLPLKLRLDPSIDADFQLRFQYGEVQKFRVVFGGSVYLTASGWLEVTAAFSAKLKCELELLRPILPVGGAISFIVAPVLPMGVGLAVDGVLELAQMRLGFEGKAGVSVSHGFDYTARGGLTTINTFEPLGEAKPVVELPAPMGGDTHLKLGIQEYWFTRLSLGFFPYLNGPKFDFFEGTLGPRAEVDYASENAQIADTDYASSYWLRMRAKLGFGSAVTDALKFLGGKLVVTPPDLTQELVLAVSPLGKLTASPAEVDPNEAVNLVVNLDPNTTSIFGVDNVDEVIFYRAPKPPLQLVKLGAVKAAPGQTEFRYAWGPTRDESGDHRIVAFVRPKLLGFGALPALEVAKNSAVDVKVTGDVLVPPGIAGVLRFKSSLEKCENATTVQEFTLFPDGSVADAVYNTSSCMAADGKTYAGITNTWTGSNGHIEIRSCCAVGSPDCSPDYVVYYMLDWNPVTKRWEGYSDSDPPNPPDITNRREVCSVSHVQKDFTGVCIAPGCTTVTSTCNGTPGNPRLISNCGAYCSPACSECNQPRPYPWEASVTPLCF